GTSLPVLLPMGLHHFEAWNEALSEGAWGEWVRPAAEWMRQVVDLEHWAAFQASFQELCRMVVEVATGRRGAPPATVCFLSGDVHHSYLAEADLAEAGLGEAGLGDAGVGAAAAGQSHPGRSRLLQAVCSPMRNRLPRAIRLASTVSVRSLAWRVGLLAARAAKVPDPPFRWSTTDGPWFDNALATMHIEGRRAWLRWDTAQVDTSTDGGPDVQVRPLHGVRLT
ncbi:MAG TPA: hypothetical protein VFJ14_11560, partial [Nocardioidaceae bacterium]|nr:hypothetical protein [Nocardioidaceae bacterium]